MKQRYLFIDTETTGLDPTINEVIEVGAIGYLQGDDDDRPTELCRYVCKLRAEKGEVDLEAIQINQRRLTEDLVIDSVSTIEIQQDIVYGLADFLASEATKDTFIIGANIQFDINFLQSLLKSYGIDGKRIFRRNKLIDIQQVARFLNDAGVIDVPNFKLMTLAQYFKVSAAPHNAMMDAITTAGIYFEMRDML